MLYLDDIKVEFESQGFKGTHIGISHDKDKSVLFLESVKSTQTVRCPYCGGSVYIYENGQVKLKDIPLQKNDCIPTFRLECSRFLFGLFFYSSLLIIFILHRSSNKYRVYIYLYRRNQAYRQGG